MPPHVYGYAGASVVSGLMGYTGVTVLNQQMFRYEFRNDESGRLKGYVKDLNGKGSRPAAMGQTMEENSPFSDRPQKPSISAPFPDESTGPRPTLDSSANVRHVKSKSGAWMLVVTMVAVAALVAVLYLIGHRPRMGHTGLIGSLVTDIGLFILGVFLIIGGVLVVRWAIGKTKGDSRAASDRALSTWKNVAQILLNITCYGGLGGLALAALIAIFNSSTKMGTMVLIVIVVGCVTGIVFFRRWRRKHPVSLQRFWTGVSIVVLLAGGVAALWFGACGTRNAILDLGGGAETADLMYISSTRNVPSGRNAAFSQTTETLYFQTKSTQRGPDDIHVTITETEFAQVASVLKPGYEATVTYYPNSRVLDSVS